MALRHHLRAEQHRALGPREARERRLQIGGTGGRVRVQPDSLEGGNVLFELPLQPLRPRAYADELGRAAGRAEVVLRLRVATVVTAEGAARVQDEGDVAARAAARLAAGAAMQRRHETAAVEQQDRLAPLSLDA